MSQKKYKTPKPGGAEKIKEVFNKQRRRKPSKTLLDILKKRSNQRPEGNEKVAKPSAQKTSEP